MAQSIQDVMTPNPRTVDVNEPLSKAAEAMKETDAGTVLVTDRDIVVRGLAEGHGPDDSVDTVWTEGGQTLTPDQSVDDAIDIVRNHNVRRVPVVQDGRPVGIVSIGDLAIERDEHSALADLSSAPPNN